MPPVQEVFTGPQVWFIGFSDALGKKSILPELWMLPVSEEPSSAHQGRAAQLTGPFDFN